MRLVVPVEPAAQPHDVHHTERVGDVPFDPCRECDDVATLKAAARQGLGIVALPAYVAREEIQKGEWVRVLPQWTAGVATVSLLMPSRRGLLPSVRPFAEFLAERVPDIVEGSAPDARHRSEVSRHADGPAQVPCIGEGFTRPSILRIINQPFD